MLQIFLVKVNFQHFHLLFGIFLNLVNILETFKFIVEDTSLVDIFLERKRFFRCIWMVHYSYRTLILSYMKFLRIFFSRKFNIRQI